MFLKDFYKMLVVLNGTQELLDNLPYCDILVIFYDTNDKSNFENLKLNNLPITVKQIYFSFRLSCINICENILDDMDIKLPFDCKMNFICKYCSNWHFKNHTSKKVNIGNKEDLCILWGNLQCNLREKPNSEILIKYICDESNMKLVFNKRKKTKKHQKNLENIEMK